MFSKPLQSLNDQIQGRLLSLAAVFLFIYSIALTLSPAARARTWDVYYRWDHWLGFLLWVILFGVIHQQSSRWLPDRDPYLVAVVALLSGWGLLTVWRLTPDLGLRQSVWLLVASVIFTLGIRLPSDLSFLRRYKYLWLTGGLVLTALTLLLGTNPLGYGPRLWLGCCGIYIQPSEPLKLLLIVYLAAYLADQIIIPSGSQRNRALHTNTPTISSGSLITWLAPTLIMTGLAMLLLIVQRDLGTAAIFLFIYAIVVFIATGQKRVLVASALAIGLAGLAGYELFDVVRLRVDAWLNPWLDPSGRSYQIVQSLLAIANGGLVGRGPGLGNPGLVPVSHSDFIFAALVEENGLIGAIGLLILLALMAARGMRVTINASDPYRRYVAAGLTTYLVGQSILIIGGNLRLLPLTGVTLPFVSYGGSSLVTSFLILLILLHISNKTEVRATPLQNTRPYLAISGLLLAGIAATTVITGWWTFYRAPILLTRTDNTRRAIADRYVRRGSILDRHNNPLVEVLGQPGSYTRHNLDPALGSIIGYTHPVYGQFGLESSLDPYLRGLQDNPSLSIWWNHLLYGQPPPGLDVRLSLDSDLQKTADSLLGDNIGALVLLNPQSGEILVMASHPTFDPDQLDQNWANLVQDKNAPFFNRATLGQYTPGSALGPLLMAAASAQGGLPPLPQILNNKLGEVSLACSQAQFANTWVGKIIAGCPDAVFTLGSALGSDHLLDLFHNLGLYTAPNIRLPTASTPQPLRLNDPGYAALGLSNTQSGSNRVLLISPLQMALAVAPLSAGGVRPTPILVMAVDTPQYGWVILPPSGKPTQVFTIQVANETATLLASDNLPIWQSAATATNGNDQTVTWYLSGTLPDRQGTPFILVLLLEENNPSEASQIGQSLIQAILHP